MVRVPTFGLVTVPKGWELYRVTAYVMCFVSKPSNEVRFLGGGQTPPGEMEAAGMGAGMLGRQPTG